MIRRKSDPKLWQVGNFLFGTIFVQIDLGNRPKCDSPLKEAAADGWSWKPLKAYMISDEQTSRF